MAGGTTNIFISAQYLRENSIINDNVDANVLQPIIRTAQDKYIQSNIGTSLYNKLISDVSANTLSGNYILLMEEYIIPILVQYSVYEAVPFMNFKFRNKAISKQSSDNSVPADLQELAYIRDNVLATAQFYCERMIQYLRLNSVLFPEYHTWVGGIAPAVDNYFNGIHIPKKGIRRCFGDPGGEFNVY
jgi:hypothetical protein